MKLVILANEVIRTAPPMARDQWLAWLKARGIDPEKVVRVRTDEDLKATVFEVVAEEGK